MSDKQPCYCAAHGCPLLGTMSTHTNGASEWWCFLHFGKEAGRLQPLTVEINRREWLARACTDLRMVMHTDRWEEVCKVAMREFAMHQRGDLKPVRGESAWRWVLRLERELEAMCRGELTNPPKQERMPVEEAAVA